MHSKFLNFTAISHLAIIETNKMEYQETKSKDLSEVHVMTIKNKD